MAAREADDAKGAAPPALQHAIVACNTCRFSKEAREDGNGKRGGALMVEALRAARESDPRYAVIAIEEIPCLFACTEYCTVHLRGADKISYVLGRFEPGEDAARALLDYMLAYRDSEHGRVPFRQWPQGVKGHFITRSPPPGYTE